MHSIPGPEPGGAVAWSGDIDTDNAETVYEEGQPVLVCSAGHYDHHERFTGETLSNLT